MTATARWRCPHVIDDVLLAWEGEQHVVFFSPDSGDTHLLATLAAQLAEWLAEAPLTRDQLLERLRTQVDWDELPPPDALAELLDHHLRRLAQIQLLTEEPRA